MYLLLFMFMFMFIYLNVYFGLGWDCYFLRVTRCHSFFAGATPATPATPPRIGGLLLIGCGWGLCWTPVLPSMVEAAAAQLKDTPADQGRHAVSPAVSSVFNASAALGLAVGPLMGTWLLPKNFQLGPKVRGQKLVVTYFFILDMFWKLIPGSLGNPRSPIVPCSGHRHLLGGLCCVHLLQ